MQVNATSVAARPADSGGVAPGREVGDWQARGLCLDVPDPDELFFPMPAEEPAAALALCARCVVRVECLTHALSVPERYGVWGGTTEEERAGLLRATRRAAKAAQVRGAAEVGEKRDTSGTTGRRDGITCGATRSTTTTDSTTTSVEGGRAA